METRRQENVLGALALALVDELAVAVAQEAGHGAAAPAAIVGIGTTPGLTIDQLRAILGLSHSGTVRLIDRLAADGLVERRPARDGRAVALSLTEAGGEAMERVLSARQQLLARTLTVLSAEEQVQLTTMLERLLTSLTRGREGADHICRLCNEAVCPSDRCPVERAVTGTLLP